MKTNASGLAAVARREWLIRLSVALFASLVLAILGPFGTYENYSFPERLLYWGGLVMGLVVPAYFVRCAVYRSISAPPLKQDIVAACVVSLLIGPIVWAFNQFFMGFDMATPLFFLEHVAIVLVICLVPVSIRAYMRMSIGEIHAQAAANDEQQPVMTEAQAAFLRRLPPEKRGYVTRVSADDHQVEVWTDLGNLKLRLRFGDAMEELTEFDGTRIHRSHWVAYRSIKAVVPDGRRHTVRLACGTQLPVSQNGLVALKAAGFVVQESPNRKRLSEASEGRSETAP